METEHAKRNKLRFTEPDSPSDPLPGAKPGFSLSPGLTEDGFIDLISDTLREVELPVQAAFLQKLMKCLASVDVQEASCLATWEEILRRRNELISLLNRSVSLRTAAVDYFGSGGLLKNPIVLEYEEFKRLRLSAATDPLTGFYNRRLFEDYLARELSRASRYNTPFALLLIDLRGFKAVNDTCGHAVGDEVLRILPRACDETIRSSDYPFRIGGDEFAILLPQSDSHSAESLAGRIAQSFERYAKSVAPNVVVGLDYGVGSFPNDGATAATLFEAADRKLYANKRNAYHQSENGLSQAAAPVPIAQPAGSSSARSAGAGEREEKESKVTPMPAAPSANPTPKEEVAEIAEIALTGASEPAKPNGEHTRRHDERFPLEGSWSLGVILAGSYTELVRILDISSGGVALLIDDSVELPERFQARLNVPVFAAGGLTLRRLYARQAAKGKQRVGCAFDA